jgi:hypothetical protein
MASVKGLTDEVREALAAVRPAGLTTAELVERCSCADTAQAVSKIIYAMRQSGEVVSEVPASGEGRHVHRLADRMPRPNGKTPRKSGRAPSKRVAGNKQARRQQHADTKTAGTVGLGGTDDPGQITGTVTLESVRATAYRLSEHLDQLALDAEDVLGEALNRNPDPDLIRCLSTAQGAIHRAARRALIQELQNHV